MIKETICPLCPYGCKLGVEIKPGFFSRINYSGPLCARGNAFPLILSSPQRLYSPRWQGKEISWPEALFEAIKLLKNFSQEKVVICSDSSLTLKEREAVKELASVLGTKELFHFNLENFTNYLVEGVKIASREHLLGSEVILVIGDLFSRFPLFAQLVLNGKYEKKTKIFVLDHYPNRIAGFADEFLLSPPGKEVSLLREGKEKIFSLFAQAKTGVLILDAPPGKFFDPIGLHFASQLFLLRIGGEKYFLPVSQMVGGEKTKRSGEVWEKMKEGDNSLFLFFGEEPPIIFPKNRYAIYFTPWRLNFDEGNSLLLPIPHLIEKEGEILTFWGKFFKPGLPPYSGTKGIEEVIGEIKKNFGEAWERIEERKTVVTKKEAEGFLEGGFSPSGENGELWLLNDEKAIEYRGFFDKGEEIKISPEDAVKMGIKEKDWVLVGEEKVRLQVKIKEGIFPGFAYVSLANFKVRRLFEMIIDRRLREIILRPAFAKIWKEK
ncbi:MAG: hypothetical protein ABIK94_02370 [candidate division WOR-3 bacterium]